MYYKIYSYLPQLLNCKCDKQMDQHIVPTYDSSLHTVVKEENSFFEDTETKSDQIILDGLNNFVDKDFDLENRESYDVIPLEENLNHEEICPLLSTNESLNTTTLEDNSSSNIKSNRLRRSKPKLMITIPKLNDDTQQVPTGKEYCKGRGGSFEDPEPSQSLSNIQDKRLNLPDDGKQRACFDCDVIVVCYRFENALILHHNSRGR